MDCGLLFLIQVCFEGGRAYTGPVQGVEYFDVGRSCTDPNPHYWTLRTVGYRSVPSRPRNVRGSCVFLGALC